jgi:CelD/BcsL family acetyltransferase involved in cellulose biosynthesis
VFEPCASLRQRKIGLVMTADQLKIRTYRDLDELQTICESWKELLVNYPLATTFSTPEWLMSWWRNFGRNQELLVGGFFADSGLVAIAPLSITPVRIAKSIPLRLLCLMGDGSNDSDNLDLPVRAGFEATFAESLLCFLESEETSWDFARLNTIPPKSPGGTALRQLLSRRKWIAFEKQTPASAIALPATWEEYMGSLSAKERGKIAYYSKRLEKKYQVRFYRCEKDSELPRCLEALFKLHQTRWQSVGEPGTFESAERRKFYLDLGRLLLSQGLLEFWLLELNGMPAAAQFGFRFDTTVSQLQEGFDRAYSTDSVGYVLRAKVIQELIAQGVRTYDFLGGTPGYKAKWGAQPGHYLDLTFARPYSAGAAYVQAQHYAGRSKEWLRHNLPAAAWDLLHKINVGVRPTGKKNGSKNNGPREESAEDPG